MYTLVHISAVSTFKCSYDHIKLKFFRTFNALYYRSHCSNSELVSNSIEFVKAYCLPLLLHAVESTAPAKQDVRMMDNDKCIDVAVRKIFRLSCSADSAVAARELLPPKANFCFASPPHQIGNIVTITMS